MTKAPKGAFFLGKFREKLDVYFKKCSGAFFAGNQFIFN